jgi:hypothetical protein
MLNLLSLIWTPVFDCPGVPITENPALITDIIRTLAQIVILLI